MSGVLYEITYRLDWKLFIPVIMAVVFLFMFIKEIKTIRREKTVKGHTVQICILSSALVIIFAVCGLLLASQIDMHQNIVAAYQKGQYETVEGYVENFVPMPAEGHAQETFEIDGVAFGYSDNTVLQGYNNTSVYGGVISGNGQHLRIRYIYYEPWDCNVIVYIEEIDS